MSLVKANCFAVNPKNFSDIFCATSRSDITFDILYKYFRTFIALNLCLCLEQCLSTISNLLKYDFAVEPYTATYIGLSCIFTIKNYFEGSVCFSPSLLEMLFEKKFFIQDYSEIFDTTGFWDINTLLILFEKY